MCASLAPLSFGAKQWQLCITHKYLLILQWVEHLFIKMTSSNRCFFSALLALCAGNSQVTGEFPSQTTNNAELWCFFHVGQRKLLSKRSNGWWSGTPWCLSGASVMSHGNGIQIYLSITPCYHKYHFILHNDISISQTRFRAHNDARVSHTLLINWNKNYFFLITNLISFPHNSTPVSHNRILISDNDITHSVSVSNNDTSAS